MSQRKPVRSAILLAAACSIAISSAASAAAPANQDTDPLVALSVLGSESSQAAFRAANGPALTMAAAQVGYDERDRRGAGVVPVLIAIALMIAAFFLLDDEVLGDEDDDLEPGPVSPS